MAYELFRLMIRSLIIFFLTLVVTAECNANSLPMITNVRMIHPAPGKAKIIYDLFDEDDDRLEVRLRLSPKDSSFLKQPSKLVYGDIGGKIQSGRDRCIWVDYKGDSLVFPPLLLAYDGTGFGGEMIKITKGKKTFYLDKYEVTNEEFAAFVELGGYGQREYWLITDGSVTKPEIGWNNNITYEWNCPRFWDFKKMPYFSGDPYSNSPHSPVTGVSWFEAYAYSKWAGKRLPTLYEWDLASGQVDNLSFPWGDGFFNNQNPPFYNLCNWRLGYKGYTYKGFSGDGFPYAAPVGSYSPQGDSPWGISDMMGNCWEWCNDGVGNMGYATICTYRALKGGGWKATISYLSPDDRRRDNCPLLRTNSTGFRCAR